MAQRGHVQAEGVCRVLLELAVDHFAERGKEELIAWEFESSSKLGEFIHQQASEGAIELADEESVSEFEGWFDLQQPPHTWKLQW